MSVKKTLTENQAQELADIIQNHAFLSMTVKADYWNENPHPTFCPIIRVQSKADLTTLQQKYGGSLYTYPTPFDYQIPKQAWTWNIKMMHDYLPLIIDHLDGKTEAKAELILKALKHIHGRGKPQDTEGLKEIYIELKRLQEPRKQKIIPWDDDKLPFT
jgi:hypothetical protein